MWELAVFQNTAPFLITLPIYMALFIFEIAVFRHFFIKSSKARISKLFRNYTLALIIIVVVTLCLEVWFIVIDLSTKLPSLNGFCFVEMYVRILSFILLEAAMFLFWIIKIRHIFSFSSFALSNTVMYGVFICVPLIGVALMVVLGLFMSPSSHSIQPSFNASLPILSDGYGCMFGVNGIDNIPVKTVLIIGQVFAFTLNILYSVIFYRKLLQYQFTCATAIKALSTNSRVSAIDILMQKHTLLALISCISAMIVYSIFNVLLFNASTPSQTIAALQYGFLLIDVDLVLKSITMLLMLNLYTKRFFQCCWCCIRISVIDYSVCCNWCSVVSRDNFNDEVPVFEKIYSLSTVHRKASENVDMIYEDKYALDSQQYSGLVLREELGEEFYPIRKINYRYFCLLVKCCVTQDSSVYWSHKVYQYAIDGEALADQESIFKQITKYQSESNVSGEGKRLCRKNPNKIIFGNFKDSNEKHSEVSQFNFCFRESLCKYSFIVALKCDSSVHNGDILARYVQERIEMNIEALSAIENFEYEPLLKEIVNELETKQLDKNILYKRVLAKDERSEIQMCLTRSNSDLYVE